MKRTLTFQCHFYLKLSVSSCFNWCDRLTDGHTFTGTDMAFPAVLSSSVHSILLLLAPPTPPVKY